MSGTWWPAAGRRSNASGAIEYVGYHGYYWSSSRYTSTTYRSYSLSFDYTGGVTPSNNRNRSNALSVRCVQERGNASRGTWDGGLGSVVCVGRSPQGERVAGEAEQGRRVVRRGADCPERGADGIAGTARRGLGRPWRCYATTDAEFAPSKLKDKHPTGCFASSGSSDE